MVLKKACPALESKSSLGRERTASFSNPSSHPRGAAPNGAGLLAERSGRNQAELQKLRNKYRYPKGKQTRRFHAAFERSCSDRDLPSSTSLAPSAPASAAASHRPVPTPQKCSACEPSSEQVSPEHAARLLELCIAGGVGFWITLACSPVGPARNTAKTSWVDRLIIKSFRLAFALKSSLCRCLGAPGGRCFRGIHKFARPTRNARPPWDQPASRGAPECSTPRERPPSAGSRQRRT